MDFATQYGLTVAASLTITAIVGILYLAKNGTSGKEGFMSDDESDSTGDHAVHQMNKRIRKHIASLC